MDAEQVWPAYDHTSEVLTFSAGENGMIASVRAMTWWDHHCDLWNKIFPEGIPMECIDEFALEPLYSRVANTYGVVLYLLVLSHPISATFITLVAAIIGILVLSGNGKKMWQCVVVLLRAASESVSPKRNTKAAFHRSAKHGRHAR